MPSRDERKAQFKNAFKKLGTIVKASEATGIARATHYQWCRDDAEYKNTFHEAQADFAETVENVLFDRVLNDKKCAPVLVIFALKGLMRDKYGDKPMEVAGEDEDLFARLERINNKKVSSAAKTLAKELIIDRDNPLGVISKGEADGE